MPTASLMAPRERGRRGRAALLPVAVLGCPFVLPNLSPFRCRAPGGVPAFRTLRAEGLARQATASFSAPLRRLDLKDKSLVGAGYDLVDVRVLTRDGMPVEATFMLDSGLSTNLVSPSLLAKLGLEAEAEPMPGTALGGSMLKLSSTLLPGLELLGAQEGTRYAGIWEGDGWRAWCTIDWDDWKAAARSSKTISGQVQYQVLPSQEMSDGQLELVGWRGLETVEGQLEEGCFKGKGVAVEPKGVLAKTELYEFQEEGDSLVEKNSGMRLQRRSFRPSVPLPGPLHATVVPFTQEQLAKAQGIELDGMLGQLPLYQDFAVEVDPEAQQLTLRVAKEAQQAALQAGMRRLAGIDLPSRLMGVEVFHASLTEGAGSSVHVPALVDSGSANSVVNWPAASLLFGIKQGDKIVRDAPRIRAIGVGGGTIDMPLLRFSIGLVGEGDSLPPSPVRVAIGDAEVFAEIFGREESGGWPFGLGTKPLKPAALIGQDVLSQRRHSFVAAEPALYVSPGEKTEGKLQHMGEGDCVDASGRRLPGLQKLGCTTDDAAWECLSLPAGACAGIAVTPQGAYQGLCYIFVHQDLGKDEVLRERGFVRYQAPGGQDLAPAGSVVARADGTKDAQCYKWKE
ncbi:unnamed protein product [Effrenium voratum]|uniref:Peptidase A2 domain-containing protein n=1 Tax=Effrenium voratum TaxID=2562239 RepID=A0AA36IUG3_9DINO|nr:unnamed protein product [Effrenium voratum]